MRIEVLDERCKPYLGSSGAAGIDLRARCLGNVPPAHLIPGTKYIFGLGIKTNIPKGWVGLVMPRSGLGFKYEVMLANTTGVIDSDYRGEIMVKLVNRGKQDIKVIAYDDSGDFATQHVTVFGPAEEASKSENTVSIPSSE